MNPDQIAEILFKIEQLKKEERKKEREEKKKEEEEYDGIEEEQEEEEEKKFDLHSSSVFLTFPHCDDMQQDDFLACIQEKVGDNLKEYHIALEDHKDGTKHAHCLYKFKTKIRVRDCRFFDAYWYHPNIESTRNWGKVLRYVYKGDGDAPNVMHNTRFDWSKTGGFKRRREDYLQWKREILQARRLERIDNIKAYDHDFPIVWGSKKRHLWFFGEASTGKTAQVMKNLRKKYRYFKAGSPAPGNTGLYGTFDRYAGERIIVWDDTAEGLNKVNACACIC